jgi:hypothetical protein
MGKESTRVESYRSTEDLIMVEHKTGHIAEQQLIDAGNVPSVVEETERGGESFSFMP